MCDELNEIMLASSLATISAQENYCSPYYTMFCDYVDCEFLEDRGCLTRFPAPLGAGSRCANGKTEDYSF